MNKQQKKSLYESIIKQVAKTVKNILNEGISVSSIYEYVKDYIMDNNDIKFLNRYSKQMLQKNDIEQIKNYLSYDFDITNFNDNILYNNNFLIIVNKRINQLSTITNNESDVIDIIYNWFIKYAKNDNDPSQIIDDYRCDRPLTGMSQAGIFNFKKAIRQAKVIADDSVIETVLKDFEHLGDYAKYGDDAIFRVKKYFNK